MTINLLDDVNDLSGAQAINFGWAINYPYDFPPNTAIQWNGSYGTWFYDFDSETLYVLGYFSGSGSTNYTLDMKASKYSTPSIDDGLYHYIKAR